MHSLPLPILLCFLSLVFYCLPMEPTWTSVSSYAYLDIEQLHCWFVVRIRVNMPDAPDSTTGTWSACYEWSVTAVTTAATPLL